MLNPHHETVRHLIEVEEAEAVVLQRVRVHRVMRTVQGLR